MATIQVISFIAGAVFILIAVIGGGFTIKEIMVPSVPKAGRIGSGIVGALFISYSLLVTVIPILRDGRTADESSTNVPVPHREENIYVNETEDISPHGIKVLGLRALSLNDPPRVNDRIIVQFSLQNVKRDPIALNPIFIGARDPAGKNVDFGRENYEKVLAPDEVVNIKSSIIVTEGGVWKFWPCYKTGGTYCPDEWRAFQIFVIGH
jgi:hypothetical protein